MLLSAGGNEGIFRVLSRLPVLLPRDEGAWLFGGFGDGGVVCMDYFFSLWAHRVPRMMGAVAVYAAGACACAPLVIGHTQVLGVAPGAGGAGLTTFALKRV